MQLLRGQTLKNMHCKATGGMSTFLPIYASTSSLTDYTNLVSNIHCFSTIYIKLTFLLNIYNINYP